MRLNFIDEDDIVSQYPKYAFCLFCRANQIASATILSKISLTIGVFRLRERSCF